MRRATKVMEPGQEILLDRQENLRKMGQVAKPHVISRLWIPRRRVRPGKVRHLRPDEFGYISKEVTMAREIKLAELLQRAVKRLEGWRTILQQALDVAILIEQVERQEEGTAPFAPLPPKHRPTGQTRTDRHSQAILTVLGAHPGEKLTTSGIFEAALETGLVEKSEQDDFRTSVSRLARRGKIGRERISKGGRGFRYFLASSDER